MGLPKKDAGFSAKLKSDYNNSYYKGVGLYIAGMVTLIFLATVLDWRL